MTASGKVVAGALLLATAVGGGAIAVAGDPAVVRQDNGAVGINGNALDAWYYGRTVTAAEIEDLNDDGKAMFGSNSIELACHGISLYVDTEAESEAYGEGYAARVKAVAARRAALAPGTDPADSDPCAWWKDPIPGLARR